jgi:hypothetical protein
MVVIAVVVVVIVLIGVCFFGGLVRSDPRRGK